MTLPTASPASDLLAELYRALDEQRWDDVLARLSDDVVLHVPGDHDGAGTHVGRDELAGFVLSLAGKADDGEHFEVLDILEGADHVAVYCRVTAQRAGREPLDNLTVHLARIQDEQIVEIWFHNFDDGLVSRFWA